MSASTAIPDLPAFQLLGQPVEISDIEKALQNLFLESEDPDSGETSGVARASLINLAVYNENQDELENDADVLSELTSESACRSLLINADTRSGEPEARAWVQVHCQIDKNGKKTVCTEQISFFLSGDSPGLLRNIVFSHLDSDLPLAFWWKGEFSDAFEQGLYSRIDRLLFDSERWESPRNQFIRLLEAQRDQSAPFVMHDLAFTRLNAIRTAIANAFDRPAVVQQLSSLGDITLRFAEGYQMSALYLAAWIAERLGASPDSGPSSPERFVFSSPREGFPSTFSIRLEELSADRKGTVEVDLELKDARIEISRCQTRDFLRTLVHLHDCSTDEDWLPARKLTDVALVSDILNRAGRNRTHSLVLPVVQELLTY
ncbi:MAG: glucose-6-phosphate dehydrogenase assembly protein OpcA [Verrucomicrobiales bacterium]|nr:glucose-6-phosphate dehydrogenase assembly protein OpcA [Verrucomicrobiales bacterium]